MFSSGGPSVRFLTRYDGEVSEPLVGRQGSRVSMRVARGARANPERRPRRLGLGRGARVPGRLARAPERGPAEPAAMSAEGPPPPAARRGRPGRLQVSARPAFPAARLGSAAPSFPEPPPRGALPLCASFLAPGSLPASLLCALSPSFPAPPSHLASPRLLAPASLLRPRPQAPGRGPSAVPPQHPRRKLVGSACSRVEGWKARGLVAPVKQVFRDWGLWVRPSCSCERLLGLGVQGRGAP